MPTFQTTRTKNTPSFWVRLCKTLRAAQWEILDFHEGRPWHGEWFLTVQGPETWMFAEIALKEYASNTDDAIGALVNFQRPDISPLAIVDGVQRVNACEDARHRLKSALIALGIENLAQVAPDEPEPEPDETEPEPDETEPDETEPDETEPDETHYPHAHPEGLHTDSVSPRRRDPFCMSDTLPTVALPRLDRE